jgi:RHS repeat-associated protein
MEYVQIGLYYYGARFYDAYISRFTQPDTIIPDRYDPQSYDRYAYVRNNPINRVDPSGHWDDCNLEDSQCHTINFEVTEGTLISWTSGIYGVSMANSEEMTWSKANLRTAYQSLNMINSKLNGHLKSLINGTTFKIMGGGDQYKGITSPTGIDFYVANGSTLIPNTNFLHETGHLIDFVPATANVFSGPLTADRNNPSNNPDWTANGFVNEKLLLGKLFQPVQASYIKDKAGNLLEDFDTNEYWADAFANYVADNINKSQSAGMNMYNYVNDALNPYSTTQVKWNDRE